VPITPAKPIPFPCSSPYHPPVKFRQCPMPRCSVQATAGCPVASPHCRPPIADQAIPLRCCTLLSRVIACHYYARHDAMAKHLPPRVPRSTPCWLLRACIARPLPMPPTPPHPMYPYHVVCTSAPFCCVACAFLPHGASVQSRPLVRSGQLHCSKARSFASSRGCCRHARVASQQNARMHTATLSGLALTRSA
jgi:hypothetical protein